MKAVIHGNSHSIDGRELSLVRRTKNAARPNVSCGDILGRWNHILSNVGTKVKLRMTRRQGIYRRSSLLEVGPARHSAGNDTIVQPKHTITFRTIYVNAGDG